MFGRAVYFAGDPKKSCDFAPTGEMVMCRVALGRTSIVRFQDASLTSDTLRAQGYNSVTAYGNNVFRCCNSVNRTEYAIFDPDMSYPEYHIKFTRLVGPKSFKSYLVGGDLLYGVSCTLPHSCLPGALEALGFGGWWLTEDSYSSTDGTQCFTNGGRHMTDVVQHVTGGAGGRRAGPRLVGLLQTAVGQTMLFARHLTAGDV